MSVWADRSIQGGIETCTLEDRGQLGLTQAGVADVAETIHGPPRKYDPNLLAIMGNPKTKRAEGQLKMRSNQKVEENKLGLK